MGDHSRTCRSNTGVASYAHLQVVAPWHQCNLIGTWLAVLMKCALKTKGALTCVVVRTVQHWQWPVDLAHIPLPLSCASAPQASFFIARRFNQADTGCSRHVPGV